MLSGEGGGKAQVVEGGQGLEHASWSATISEKRRAPILLMKKCGIRGGERNRIRGARAGNQRRKKHPRIVGIKRADHDRPGSDGMRSKPVRNRIEVSPQNPPGRKRAKR